MRSRIYDFDVPELKPDESVPHTRPLALLTSAVVHATALVLLHVVSSYLSWLHEDDADRSRYRIEFIRLRPSEPAPLKRNATPGTGMRAESSVRPSSVPAEMELPMAHELANAAPVIFQPDIRPDIKKVPDAMPELRFWARREPALPHPLSPGDVVVPGRTEALAAPPRPAAPPVAAATNRESFVSDINVSIHRRSTSPSLTVSNSATMPVRLRSAQTAVPAAFELAAGQPVNVIALAADRPHSIDVEVARGLRNIPHLAAGDATGTITPSRGALSNTIATVGTPGRLEERLDLIRIQHPPNGNFDVVVTQSATPEDLADLGIRLTGNPVFTVYLQVGDRKEWLLEYCLPGRQKPPEDLYQIDTADVASIVAPYPITTVIPRAILEQEISRHVVFHGLLTASGSLSRLRGLDTNNTFVTQMLDVLKDWRFRSALRNNRAIEVEVLLVIPTRS
jgi:hypothetical protein